MQSFPAKSVLKKHFFCPGAAVDVIHAAAGREERAALPRLQQEPGYGSDYSIPKRVETPGDLNDVRRTSHLNRCLDGAQAADR